jgi:hypothetical protein
MYEPDPTMTSAIAAHQANIFVTHNNGDSLSDDDLKLVQEILGEDLKLRDGETGVTFPPEDDSKKKLYSRDDEQGGEAEMAASPAKGSEEKLPVVTMLAAQDIAIHDTNPVAKLDDEVEVFRRVQSINNKPETRSNSRNLTITSSPNWQMGSTMYISPGGGGGPGKHRYEADVQDLSKLDWDVPAVITNREKPGGPNTIKSRVSFSKVNVFILDTVPPKETVKLWKGRAKHRLSALLGVGGVELYYAEDEKIEILPAVQRAGHPEDLYSRMTLLAKDVPGSDWALNLPEDENISDHGIFIAGIIHSMVPTAKLHLIQVLNDGGAGTMRSLTQGLQVMGRIMKADPTTPAVVNLSLAFCNPQQIFINAIDKGFDCQIKLWAEFLDIKLPEDEVKLLSTVFPDSDESDQKKAKNVLKDKYTIQADDLFTQTVQPLELIYQLAQAVATPNTVFVAAAGNDGGTLPRYPASSQWIYGVGAVGKKAWNTKSPELKPTSYSNNPPDSQPLEGSWAFGGDYKDDGSNKEDGILSVSTVSSTGYAWWAGTSFATAVMSGTMARYIRTADTINAQSGVDFIQKNGKHGRVLDRNNKDRGPLIDTKPH